MKKSILQRIKWGNVSLLLATGAVAVAGAWGIYHNKPIFDYSLVKPNDVVTYNYRIQAGDTLWSVCSEAKLPEQDVRELVFRTMEDNGLKDAGKLEPGRIITIKLIRRN